MRRRITDDELKTPLIPLAQALEAVERNVFALDPEVIDTRDANRRVLASDVFAPVDVPGFDNSAMDGYAVCAADFVDACAEAPVIIDENARIATGAPIPQGADSVVPWEQTVQWEGKPAVMSAVRPSQHVRQRGAEVQGDTRALPANTLLRAPHIGLLRAIGVDKVNVVRQPRVAIAATGNELVPAGEALTESAIYSSNDAVLRAIAEQAGTIVDRLHLLPDDPQQIEHWMQQAARECDMVVTTGGASVGERDWTRTALMKLGAMHFWHVDIKPGKPVAFGTIEGTPVLVLPGNPGAVFACSQLLMVPALLKMHGRSFDETRSTAKLLQSVTGDAKRNVLQPVITSTDGVRPLPSGSSQLLGPFLDADTIAIIPPGGADMGTQVQTMSVTG